MSVLQISAIAFLITFGVLVLKNCREEFVLPLKLAGSAVLLLFALGMSVPLIGYIDRLSDTFGKNEWTALLLKGLGIAVLSEVCAGICRECGEAGAASGVELAGKIEILLLCLPMIEKILQTSREILSL